MVYEGPSLIRKEDRPVIKKIYKEFNKRISKRPFLEKTGVSETVFGGITTIRKKIDKVYVDSKLSDKKNMQGSKTKSRYTEIMKRYSHKDKGKKIIEQSSEKKEVLEKKFDPVEFEQKQREKERNKIKKQLNRIRIKKQKKQKNLK